MFDSKQALDSIAGESSLDKLIPMEALCRASYDEGHLRNLPEDRREFITAPEIILTAKRRLHHLGYLGDFARDGSLPASVRTAIRQLQTEAGIRVDGWIGGETWSVFEQLFNFEMEARFEEWVRKGTCTLIHRAVQLRLFAFGLIDTPPSQRLVDAGPALERFCSMAQRLGLSSSELAPSLNALPTLKLLFDQDAITEALARVDPHFVEKLAPRDRKVVQRFLVCDAKIELWLLGYDVEPDGTASFKAAAAGLKGPAAGFKGQRERLRNISRGLYFALKRFCRDVERATKRNIYHDGFFQSFPAIFSECCAIRRAGELEDSRSEPSDSLYEALQEQSQVAEKLWIDRAVLLGGRIWDGMKRAWGWFKRLVRRGLQRLGAWLINAVRLAWQLARNSLGIIRAAIHAFPGAVEFVLRGETTGTVTESIALRHDGDFDWKVFVSSSPQAGVIAQVLAALEERVCQFGFCTRVLGLLVQALLTVGKYVETGYFALVLALVKIQNSLQEFMDYYLANKQVLLDGSPAVR